MLFIHGFFTGNFNPRSREGSDRRGTRTAADPEQFQSALPRGERPAALPEPGLDPAISIRAPARGATASQFMIFGAVCISIRAPARGATSIFAKKFSSLLAKIV